MHRRMFASLVAAAVLVAAAAAADSVTDRALQDFSLRKQLYIVGSETMKPYLQAAADQFVNTGKGPAPVIALRGSSIGMQAFCDGVGVEYPDIVASIRRMRHGEFKRCADAGVRDVIEIALGYSALALVAPRDMPTFNLKPEDVYRALAANLPQGDGFVPNPNRTWRDVDRRLPDVPIGALVPGPETGLRSMFDDYLMEGGCRYVPEIRAVFAATARRDRCVTMRGDGRFNEYREDEPLAEVLKRAEPGTIVAISHEQWEMNNEIVEAFPVSGLFPTTLSIETEEYPLTRRIYVYFKKNHMRDASGYGVVRGLREFLQVMTSEQALEPGGYFETLGLVLLPSQERAKQRLTAMLLRVIER